MPILQLSSLLLLLLVVVIILHSNAVLFRPIRNTSSGPILGYLHTEDDFVAQVFEGVPYAESPVGERRFENPVSVANWSDLFDAGPGRMPWCVQFWYPDDRLSGRNSTEDCLRLTISLPHRETAQAIELHPILVWIHGGSYQVNGGNMRTINGTVKNLVSQGLVVIFINYRLGPLDQLLALEWIGKNALNLDGDPNRIILGGESAGAACVSLLASSPRGKGLFHGIILRSGSALAPWAVRSKNTDLNSQMLIRWSGCANFPPSGDVVLRVKRCMKNVSVERMIEIWQNFGKEDLLHMIASKIFLPHNGNHPLLAHTYFTPVEDPFRESSSIIPENPRELIRKNAHLSAMIGVTSGESGIYVSMLHFLVNIARKESHLAEDFELLVPSTMYSNADQVQEAAYERYIGRHQSRIDFNFARSLVEIASDQTFVGPSVHEAHLYADKNVSVFAYVFDYQKSQVDQAQRQFTLDNVGVGHGHDMMMLFESYPLEENLMDELIWSAEDRRIINMLRKTIGDFAYGNASDFWTLYRRRCGEALIISNKAVEMGPFFEQVHNFWHKTVGTIEKLTLYGQQCVSEDENRPIFINEMDIDISHPIPIIIVIFFSIAFLVIFLLLFFIICSRLRKQSSAVIT